MTILLRRHLLFGTYCVCLVLGHLSVLWALVDFSRESVAASHVIVIPLVTVALIYQRRMSIFSSVRSSGLAGLSVILVGLGLWWLARLYRPSGGYDDSLTLMVGALAVLLVGGFLLFYGQEAFRAALFPLLFLGFMVPIPGTLLDGAILFLKTGSTESVAGLFTLTGTAYYREGFVFSLPKVVIEVTDECSGIRSGIALLLTSLLAGHMFLKSAWKRALLVVAILPITVLKNGIRIVTLSLLAMHVDSGFLMGQLHHEGGIVFFLLALAMLALPFAVLRRSETLRPEQTHAS